MPRARRGGETEQRVGVMLASLAWFDQRSMSYFRSLDPRRRYDITLIFVVDCLSVDILNVERGGIIYCAVVDVVDILVRTSNV